MTHLSDACCFGHLFQSGVKRAAVQALLRDNSLQRKKCAARRIT